MDSSRLQYGVPMRKFSQGGSVNPDRAPVWHQEPGLGWHDHLRSRSNLDTPDVANKRSGTRELPRETAPDIPELVSESLSDECFSEHIMGLLKEDTSLAEVRLASLSRWDTDAKCCPSTGLGAPTIRSRPT